MPTKWNLVRQTFLQNKYVIVVILAIVILVILNTFYLLGSWGNKNDGLKDNESINDILASNESISEDISSIVNKTSANDTTLSEASFKQECFKCHNPDITFSGIDRARCRSCHESSHGLESGEPSRYNDLGRKTVHSSHVGNVNQRDCQSCHGIPACNRCHNGHSGISDINISKNCVSCHGGLPVPKGHNEERTIFNEGSHKWMGKCNTCHLQNELRFKDIFIYDRAKNSSLLCRNCHSKQYEDTAHYTIENGIEKQSCVSCHDPHSPATAKFSLEALSSAKLSIINKFNDITEYLSANMGFLVLFVILLLSAVFEYAFGPKKGQVILSKHLSIEHDKSKARTIKISLSQPFDSAILDNVTGIIKQNAAKIVGISGGNNEVIVFISRDKKDMDKSIIENIKSISGVSKAEYSKDYETR